MAFEASRRDWSELYAFFRLLADGYVWAGGANGSPNEEKRLDVAMVQREEHDGTRKYIIEGEDIHIIGEERDESVLQDILCLCAVSYVSYTYGEHAGSQTVI